MLHSQVQSIVFNPPWNVPSSIATKELWPKEKAHPGYFAKHDFIIIPTPDGGTRLQQKAGDQAALGKIKFDFPNPYGVYLHDTPGHAAFDRYSRLESHGCVRLQKPLLLADNLLQGDPVWTPAKVDETIASGKTVRTSVPQPISVFLFYWTAYLGPDGQMNFRGDPYGWDKMLIQRINAGGGAAGT
jgi:murein L,D-transpeptidase YcbB/YkuD